MATIHGAQKDHRKKKYHENNNNENNNNSNENQQRKYSCWSLHLKVTFDTIKNEKRAQSPHLHHLKHLHKNIALKLKTKQNNH